MLSGFSYGVVTSAESSIQEKVGSGCENNVQFSRTFTTESGDKCNTCVLCDGSHLSDIFKPKSKGICVDCTAVEDTCTNFMITTTFASEWWMKFVSLAPSSKPKEYDPKAVLIEGSKDSTTWVELHNAEDDMLFKTRIEPTELLLSNNGTEYKHYRITFKPKYNMSKYYIGHYGLIPSYTKTCSSDIYEAITGYYIRPYATLAPTEAATSSPTTAPTDAPGFEMTDSNIKTAVNLWASDNSRALATYGHISTWDVSRITNMKQLFYNRKNFNENLSGWNVSAVADMDAMFSEAQLFNTPVGMWDVSMVTAMASMFTGAGSFNTDIGTWNVSRLTNAHHMFYRAVEFNQDITMWNVSNMTNMGAMFATSSKFNQDLSPWNVQQVTDMHWMFESASNFNQTLCWDMSGKAASSMFRSSDGSLCD